MSQKGPIFPFRGFILVSPHLMTPLHSSARWYQYIIITKKPLYPRGGSSPSSFFPSNICPPMPIPRDRSRWESNPSPSFIILLLLLPPFPWPYPPLAKFSGTNEAALGADVGLSTTVKGDRIDRPRMAPRSCTLDALARSDIPERSNGCSFICIPSANPELRLRNALSAARLAPGPLACCTEEGCITRIGLYGVNLGSGRVTSLRSFSLPSGTRLAKTTRMDLYR